MYRPEIEIIRVLSRPRQENDECTVEGGLVLRCVPGRLVGSCAPPLEPEGLFLSVGRVSRRLTLGQPLGPVRVRREPFYRSGEGHRVDEESLGSNY